jgi:hypothetical protein
MWSANRCIVCGDRLMAWECEYHSSCGASNEWSEPDFDWAAWSDEYNDRLAEIERRLNYECLENSKDSSATQN